MNRQPTLVVATHNPGKLAEFSRLLANVPWRICDLVEAGFDAELIEPADDYAGNAIAKAEQVCNALAMPVLADDSGIEVMALQGWPGPHSARWLGRAASPRDRLVGLINEVDKRCPGDRRVRYVAAVALARPGAATVVACGSCDGLLVEPKGSGGFAYDPGFFSNDLGVTFGEATEEQKDGVSHRARALRRLVEVHLLNPTENWVS